MSLAYRLWAAVAVCAATLVWGAENTVKEVRVRTIDQFGTDASDVLSYCSVKAGAEVSQEALSKDVRALLDTGRFGYAGVELEKVADGYNVIYVVKRRYRFQEPLAIKGADFFSETKIRKLAELNSGDYIDEPLLTTKAAKIRDEYVKKFFPGVKIGTEIQPIEGSAGFANVTFTIEEGERTKIRAYRFTNNPSVPEVELRSSFGQRPWYDPRGWFSDTPVSQQDLEDARQLAEDIYKNHGFLDAKVAFPVPEKVGKEKVDMVFDVTEGDVYTVESTAVRGVKLFPEHEVQAASARLRTDMVAGQKEIEDAAKDVRDYYGSRGYVDTSVRVIKEPIAGKPGRMAITFEVREGELVYIRNIVIRGNNKTKDKVIRREILVSPGEIMNEVRVQTSENRLKNLGYFSNVRHVTEQGEGNKRDLVYEVEEQRTGNFMVGAGFSSEDGVVGFVEVTQSNFDILNWGDFTGAGQKARLGVEAGTRRQTAEVSWTEPWFLDRPLALTVELYRRMRWYDEYDEIRTGGSVGLSYPVKLGRVGARYTLELVQMDDVDDGLWYTEDGLSSTPSTWGGTANQYFQYQEDQYGDNLDSVLRLYWAHDTRDKAFVPTRGYQTTVFGEASEGAIGDNEFYRMGVNYKHWFSMPWFKHVLSLRGRLETVDAYSGELPIYERLFLGGPRTIRGVEYRDVGPKLFDYSGDHATVGGQTLSLVTAEYTIPVFKAVRFATFMDAGALGEDAFDPQLGDLCVSFGVGLRIDIPGFPIRFDFAKAVVEDDSYTDDEFFSFAIGFE
jgi:outer membrane protein insertion porin family